MTDITKTISLKGLDQIVSEFNQLKSELAEVKGKYKELRQQTKQDSDEHLGDLKSWAAGYLSVTALWGQVSAAAQEYLAVQQKITDEYGKQNTAQTQTLFLTGQLSQGKNVDAFVQSDRSYDVTKAQAAIGGAMEGGTGLSYTQQQAVARDVMSAAHLMDAGSAGSLGQLGGRLAKAGISEAGDAAIVATQLTGKEASQMGSRKAQSSLQSLLEAGFGADRALAMVTASVDSDLGPKYMDKYLESLSSTEQVGFTTDAKKAKFLRTNGVMARDELLRSDEEVRKAVLGEKGSNEFSRTSGKIDDFERAYAARDGAGERSTAEAMQSESGADAVGAAKAAARKSQRQRKTGEKLDPYSDAMQYISEAIDAEAQDRGFGHALSAQAAKLGVGVEGRVSYATGGNAAEYATGKVNFMKEMGYSDETIRDLIETLRDNGLLVERMLNKDAAATVPSRSAHGE
jgi:hypothetical protein